MALVNGMSIFIDSTEVVEKLPETNANGPINHRHPWQNYSYVQLGFTC